MNRRWFNAQEKQDIIEISKQVRALHFNGEDYYDNGIAVWSELKDVRISWLPFNFVMPKQIRLSFASDEWNEEWSPTMTIDEAKRYLELMAFL
jgi:hypothetical protein